MQITEQHTVMLLTGSWVHEEDRRWSFDSLSEEGKHSIDLFPGMEYEELVKKVKETLGILAKNMSIKLSYQYPSWMEIDDGDGSTPQYISDDDAVEAFVQMRRKIEEVNLFVTISEHIDGMTTGKTRPPFANVTDQALILNKAEIDNASDDILEDAWLDFAMSKTPLTWPPCFCLSQGRSNLVSGWDN